MKWTMFKIILLLAVIFMKIETTTAGSCRHTHHNVPSSTSTSVSTDTDKTFHFIHAALDKTHDLFSTFTHHHSLGKELGKRIQRLNEQNIHFSLRLLLYYHSLREGGLLKDKEFLFPSTLVHCVIPSCKYYIFAMRRILI